MADGNGGFGGGGSVQWSVDVNDGDVPSITSKPFKPRGYTVSSKDNHENVGSFFEVTIEIPASGLWYTIEAGKAKLYLEIINQQDPQVNVHWALQNKPGGLKPLT